MHASKVAIKNGRTELIRIGAVVAIPGGHRFPQFVESISFISPVLHRNVLHSSLPSKLWFAKQSECYDRAI